MGFGYKANQLRNNKKKLISDINITPFVDVVLVLLISFMVTAPMLSNGFNVNLPKVSSDQLTINKKEQIIFTIDNSNNIRVDNNIIQLQSLSELLKRYNPLNTQIFIKGDTSSNYGDVIKLMSLINKESFHSISLVTEPLE